MMFGLTTLSKLFIYTGLTGLAGCFVSFFISFSPMKKSHYRVETISTFLLGSSFTGVILERYIPDLIIINIFIALIGGYIGNFLSIHFLQVGLKKSFDNEIGV